MSDPKTALREAEHLAADAIGDVIEHWGFRKALGRIWTLLYLAGEPLAAAELSERLQMSAGAVSMAVNEMQRWGVVRRVSRPGERREFYEAETDFWKMISKVISEREKFLVQSVHERLERVTQLLKQASPAALARERLDRAKRLLSFAAVAETVIDSFVASRRADFSEFGGLLQLVRPAKGRKGDS
jgi:HTH-type transcriptional regulator, glycine betaine synthesis regulator